VQGRMSSVDFMGIRSMEKVTRTCLSCVGCAQELVGWIKSGRVAEATRQVFAYIQSRKDGFDEERRLIEERRATQVVLSLVPAHSTVVLSPMSAHSTVVLSLMSAHSTVVLSLMSAHSTVVLSLMSAHSTVVLSLMSAHSIVPHALFCHRATRTGHHCLR